LAQALGTTTTTTIIPLLLYCSVVPASLDWPSGNLSRNLDSKHSKEIGELKRRRKPEIR